MVAIEMEDIVAVQILLDRSADPNLKLCSDVFNMGRKNSKYTMMHKVKNIDILQLLIQYKREVRIYLLRGYTKSYNTIITDKNQKLFLFALLY